MCRLKGLLQIHTLYIIQATIFSSLSTHFTQDVQMPFSISGYLLDMDEICIFVDLILWCNLRAKYWFCDNSNMVGKCNFGEKLKANSGFLAFLSRH